MHNALSQLCCPKCRKWLEVLRSRPCLGKQVVEVCHRIFVKRGCARAPQGSELCEAWQHAGGSRQDLLPRRSSLVAVISRPLQTSATCSRTFVVIAAPCSVPRRLGWPRWRCLGEVGMQQKGLSVAEINIYFSLFGGFGKVCFNNLSSC